MGFLRVSSIPESDRQTYSSPRLQVSSRENLSKEGVQKIRLQIWQWLKRPVVMSNWHCRPAVDQKIEKHYTVTINLLIEPQGY
ncbi:MAG: hypothetical protein KME08_16865 [Aphanothece sp. CMT-3BRIN-NPC111]|nr:hypothetical protein [Aphanothece sp. CMT-3BRIN-NPC111]